MKFWRDVFLVAVVAAGLWAVGFKDKIVPAIAAVAQVEDAAAQSPPARVFNCRAPVFQGEFVVVTIAWQDGLLVGDCDYLINQISARKGG